MLVGLWQGSAQVAQPTGETADDETMISLGDDHTAKVDSIFMMGSIGLHDDVPAGTWRVEDDRLVLVFSGHTRIAEPEEAYDPPDVGICVRVPALDGDALVGTWVAWSEADGCAPGSGAAISLTRFRSVE